MITLDELRAQLAAAQKEVEDYKRAADIRLAFLQGKAAGLQTLVDAQSVTQSTETGAETPAEG